MSGSGPQSRSGNIIKKEEAHKEESKNAKEEVKESFNPSSKA